MPPSASAPADAARAALAALFRRRVVVVSGKGGVGKTSVAAAVASLAAEAGKETLLVSTDGRGDAAALFGREAAGYKEEELAPRLHALTADFEGLLADFVRTAVPAGFLADRILASDTFRFFTRATPGLGDLLLLGKIREVLKRARSRRDAPRYDLVVLDAPATGHALSLVGVPRTLLRAVPAGPLHKLAVDLDRLLSDAASSALVVVAEPAELAAREAEELVAGAREKAGLATLLLVLNREGRALDARPVAVPDLELPTRRIEEIAGIDGNGARGESADDEAAADPFAADRRFFELFRKRLADGRAARRPREKPTAAGSEHRGRRLDVSRLAARAKLVVLMGPGGVGKTTLSSAVGLLAARNGRRVLVLTVDPARRLAQALGLEGHLDEPVEVPILGKPRGAHLFVLQIDPRALFARLLTRVATPEAFAKIRSNRFFTEFVDALPGVLEYMGVEALAEYAEDERFDLVVLDTPPAARGLDFLAAPERMVALLSNDALRWFLHGDSFLNRALSGTARGAAALLKLADKALGFGFLSDLGDFFRAFDGLYEGFERRSREIGERLDAATFLLVTSPDRSAVRTTAELLETLAERRRDVSLLLNRVPPGRAVALPRALDALPRAALFESAASGADLPHELARRLGEPG